MTARRRVAPLPAFEEAVLQDFVAAPVDCLDGAHLLLEELETQEPDLDERCGLLDGAREVYALRVPRCTRLRLAISIDRGGDAFGPVTIHGLVPSTARPCDASRRLAETHFRLIAPVWEAAR